MTAFHRFHPTAAPSSTRGHDLGVDPQLEAATKDETTAAAASEEQEHRQPLRLRWQVQVKGESQETTFEVRLERMTRITTS